MDDQTTPAFPVAVDPLDEPPPPTMTDSEDVSMVFRCAPADIVYFDCLGFTSQSCDSTTSTTGSRVVIPECPPASALFDDELPCAQAFLIHL